MFYQPIYSLVTSFFFFFSCTQRWSFLFSKGTREPTYQPSDALFINRWLNVFTNPSTLLLPPSFFSFSCTQRWSFLFFKGTSEPTYQPSHAIFINRWLNVLPTHLLSCYLLLFFLFPVHKGGPFCLSTLLINPPMNSSSTP
jgi:hypothetical protein